MARKRDRDVVALENAIRALDKSSCRQMLKANLQFLWDRYLTNPIHTLPDHLLPGMR